MAYSTPISVIMPCFNSEEYIRKAIESIFNQPFETFEFLIISGGSTDNTDSIILKYCDPRIKFFKNNINKGSYPSWNFALSKARGKYICVMDSDDIALPGRLEAQLYFMEIHPKIHLIGSSAYIDPGFGRRMHTYFYRILDRYKRPVTAIAILTDGNRHYRPESYRYDFLGAGYEFRFNTYKVLDQDEEALENDDNPFAIVIFTVLTALKNKDFPDKELFELKSVDSGDVDHQSGDVDHPFLSGLLEPSLWPVF